MPESIFDFQAALCQTMANPDRLRIVHALREGPTCVAAIAEAVHLSPASVSRQLQSLRIHGVVAAKRQGSSMIYAIANPKVTRVCDLMREILAEQASDLAELSKRMGG